MKIEKQLKNPFFVRKIKERLLKGFDHEIILKPRLYFDASSKKATTQDSFYKRDAFLTGSAVMSAIVNELFDMPYVVNDIDIFYFQYKAKNSNDAERERYNNLKEENYYNIEKSYEVGLLNFTMINQEDEFSWSNLLETFDFNYTQVGIVLATDEIIFTKQFVDFLNNKKIEFVKDFDDFNLTSLLRCSLKAKEMGLKFYQKEAEKKILAYNLGLSLFGETVVYDQGDGEDKEDPVFVSEKRLEQWSENKDILNFIKIKKNEDGYCEIYIEKQNDPFLNFCETLYTHAKTKNMNISGFFGDLILNSDIPESKTILNYKESKLKRIEALFYSNLFSDEKVLYIVKSLVSGDSKIFKKDFSEKKLKYCEKLLYSHDFFRSFSYEYVKRNLDLNPLLDFYLNLGNWPQHLVGVFEQKGLANIGEETYIKINEGKLKELYTECEVEFERILKKDWLVEPISEVNIFSKYVKEIHLASQLVKEGVKMGHCVGGYASAISRGQCRIFHISTPKGESTLELEILTYNPYKQEARYSENVGRYNNLEVITKKTNKDDLQFRFGKEGRNKKYQKNTIFVIKQHQSYRNSKPCDFNKMVAKRLVQVLNNYFQEYKINY